MLRLLIPIFIILWSCSEKTTDHNEQAKDTQVAIDISQLDGNWKLTTVNDTLFDIHQVYDLEDNKQPTLMIDTKNNKIGGYTGCNGFGGEASYEQNKIKINGPMEMTEQACGGDWEERYLQMLHHIDSCKVETQLLIIVSADQRMTFKKVEE